MIPKLVESAGNSESAGSMTAIYTVLAEGDDQQDPQSTAPAQCWTDISY